MTGATETSNNNDDLLADRDYFKHFSRLHEKRAKKSWKLLHTIEQAINQNRLDHALKLINKHLDKS